MEANFGGRLDYLTNEMCQMNTSVSCIARRQACIACRQAHIGGFAPSPSPSPEASADEGDDGDDDEDDASSSGDYEMMTSQ